LEFAVWWNSYPAYTLVRVENVDVNHPMLHKTRKLSLEVTPTTFRTIVMQLCDDDEIAVTYLQFQTQVYFYYIYIYIFLLYFIYMVFLSLLVS